VRRLPDGPHRRRLPGLFFLVDGLLGTGHICAFGSNGIAFASAFQSHIVTVDIEFSAEPDYTQPETQFTVPVSGRRDVVVTRRLLVSPATFTPPLDDPDPAGLEHWSSTVLPEHCVRVPGQVG